MFCIVYLHKDFTAIQLAVQLCILQKEHEEVIIHNKDYQRKLDALKRDRQRSVDKLIQISGDRKKALENEMSLKTRVCMFLAYFDHLMIRYKLHKKSLSSESFLTLESAPVAAGK
jgi:hypothetical protein